MDRSWEVVTMLLTKAIVLTLLLLGVTGCGGGGDDSLTPSAPSGDPRVVSIAQEMLTAINMARSTQQTCGTTVMPAVNSVGWNDKLAVAALRQSSDMASHAILSHTGSDGSSAGTRITQEGYDYRTYGENIAVGYPTIADVVQGWLNSPGHCINIMNAAFTEIGAAYDTGTYLTFSNMRYWTLDLASQ